MRHHRCFHRQAGVSFFSNGDFYGDCHRSFIAFYSYVEYQFFIIASRKINDLFTSASSRSTVTTTTSSSTSASEDNGDSFISAPTTSSLSPPASVTPSNISTNNQHLQGIVHGLGFKHAVRLSGTAAAKGINKVIAKRSYRTTSLWIQRLATSTWSSQRARLRHPSREVSTIEPSPAILLTNV